MRVIRRKMSIRTEGRSRLVDITGDLRGIVSDGKLDGGRMTVTVPHTTAGVTINEHADPDVASDIISHLDRMVPWEGPWLHGEGNSAAHIKATLAGSSVTVFIEGGALHLGTWQGVFLCEFDGPRKRTVEVTCEIW
jgi:secondary thiamine-phosphate synthase enzyme